MITSYAFMEGSIDKIVVVFLLKRWHPTNGAKADPFSEENRLQESKHGVTLSPAPWGGRGGEVRGEKGGQLPIYGIVRMCVPNGPLFQRCQVYD